MSEECSERRSLWAEIDTLRATIAQMRKVLGPPPADPLDRVTRQYGTGPTP